MGYIAVDNLEPGMVLGEDARDVNARLLLSKGQKIVPQHIRILKIWGVTAVDIVGAREACVSAQKCDDSDKIEQVQSALALVFKNMDAGDQMVGEIMRQSLAHRLRSTCPPPPVCTVEEPRSDVVLRKPDQIRQQIQKIDAKLPEAPTIISELNEVIADPFATSNDVALVVNKSPSLAAVLLRIVNSAFYGFPSKIDRISRAVTIIGTKQISSLALGISVMRAFKDIPKRIIDMQAFIQHSLFCGLVARIIAAFKNMEQTEQLFVAGLLHDIGKLIVFKYYSEYAKACLQLAGQSGRSVFETEKAIVGLNHTHIGRYLLKKWRLPSALEQTVVYHHSPGRAADPVNAGIVHVADVITHGLGIGSSGEVSVPHFDKGVSASIGISVHTIQMVIRQAVHQLGAIEAVFTE